MLDIMLSKNGDIVVSPTGDISMTMSIQQAVLVRLRWIYNEWRLGPSFGLQWFEHVFTKNPNIPKIRQLIKEEILKVDGVVSADVESFVFNSSSRSVTFVYTCATSEEKFREEVTLYA